MKDISTVNTAEGKIPYVYHKGLKLIPEFITKEDKSGRRKLVIKRFYNEMLAFPLKKNGEVVYALPGGGHILASNCDGVQIK